MRAIVRNRVQEMQQYLRVTAHAAADVAQRHQGRRPRDLAAGSDFQDFAARAQAVADGRAQVSVTTQHNDNGRTGANLSETTLNTTNVNANSFGKLFSLPVDGEIYAQPLYLPGVAIPGKGTHNVIFVCTMNDTAYAWDADDAAQTTPLWSRNFGNPVPAADVQCCCTDISSKIGILSTPVIRTATSTLYLLARIKNTDGTYHQWLHALDYTTGADKAGSPIEISATFGTSNPVTFNPKIQNQRSALTLANNTVYIAWASHNDCGAYHGWVMGYNADTLAQTAVWNTTPTGGLGGIWQAGQGLTVDGAGNLYGVTGNGTFDGDQGGTNFGDSIFKLSPGGTLTDWFTPFNQDALNAADADLGAAGALLLPGTNLIISGGKEGKLYLLNTGNMGHFHAGSDNQVAQSFAACNGHIHGSPIYWPALQHNCSTTVRSMPFRSPRGRTCWQRCGCGVRRCKRLVTRLI